MNVNRFKKAMAANLNKLDQKFDEFKSTASQNLQNFQRSREDWGAEDLNPMGNANNFPVDVPPTLDINGQTYRITKLLDEGGYSFVFTVRDVDSGKEYALKRLLIQEEEMMKIAMNEIKVMEQVNGHPNIINFEGYKKIAKGNNHNELYILMELAEDSLISVMQKKADYGEHFKEDELLKTFLQICKAVSHMHSQNPPISHRDLKVENVLISSDGLYKLCDFGSCTTAVYTLEDKSEKMIAEEDIQKNTTMAYRAPEMADLYSGWPIDEKADVWALGCVLYKMCYFVGPFEEASTLQIINCKYRIPSDNVYSNKVLDLIKYMLEVNPEKRPSVFDVLERVSGLLGVEVSVSRPAARTRPTKPVASSGLNVRTNKSSNTTVRRPAAHSRTSSSSGSFSAPKSNNAQASGGDLFGMIDWFESDGKTVQQASNSPAPKVTVSPTSNSFNGFGDEDDSWTADFSQLEVSPAQERQPVPQQSNVKRVSPIAPPSPSPKGTPSQHIRQPSNTSFTSIPSPKSGTSLGDDLFNQLDWQDSGSSNSNISPQAVTSPHRRTQSSQSGDFNLDSLFSVPDSEPSIGKILSLPGNRACADCNTRDPKTAIVNLGTLVCDACANVHRTLGEPVSRVNPLDDTLTRDQIKYMSSVGNDRANQFWEATLNDPNVKPQNSANVGALNTYIRNKYLGKRFAPFNAHRVGPMPRSVSGGLNPGPMANSGFPQPRPQQQGMMNPGPNHFNNTSPTGMISPMSPHHQRMNSNSSSGSDISFDAFKIMK